MNSCGGEGEKHMSEMKEKVKQIKEKCLDMCVHVGAGHITSAFSCAEIVVCLYYSVMHVDPCNPAWPQRDRFIMSKNHGSIITYPILEDLGFEEKLTDRFLNGISYVGGHTKIGIRGVDFAGGSLGIGIGVACGLAYGAKVSQEDWLTFVILGDGECYEGAIWEAAMFAGANQLRNLVVIIDRNGQCITDFTEKMLALDPLALKWEAFGWETRTIDGHSIDEISGALSDVRVRNSEKPLCIIANTIKGKGISFMENRLLMHGITPTGEKAVLARKDLRED